LCGFKIVQSGILGKVLLVGVDSEPLNNCGVVLRAPLHVQLDVLQRLLHAQFHVLELLGVVLGELFHLDEVVLGVHRFGDGAQKATHSVRFRAEAACKTNLVLLLN